MDEFATYMHERISAVAAARAQMLRALDADAAQKLALYNAPLGELELLRAKLPPPDGAAPAAPPAASGSAGIRAVLDGMVPLQVPEQ